MIYISFGCVKISSLNDNHSCQIFRNGLKAPTLTTPLIRANISCVRATIFSSLAFLSSSVSMANLSHLVAALFSSLCSSFFFCLHGQPDLFLLATTSSSLRYLYNSFSSPRFNLLRVARCCFLSRSLYFLCFQYLKICLL